MKLVDLKKIGQELEDLVDPQEDGETVSLTKGKQKDIEKKILDAAGMLEEDDEMSDELITGLAELGFELPWASDTEDDDDTEEEEEEEEDDENGVPEFDGMSKKELLEFAKENGIDMTGKKKLTQKKMAGFVEGEWITTDTEEVEDPTDTEEEVEEVEEVEDVKLTWEDIDKMNRKKLTALIKEKDLISDPSDYEPEDLREFKEDVANELLIDIPDDDEEEDEDPVTDEDDTEDDEDDEPEEEEEDVEETPKEKKKREKEEAKAEKDAEKAAKKEKKEKIANKKAKKQAEEDARIPLEDDDRDVGDILEDTKKLTHLKEMVSHFKEFKKLRKKLDDFAGLSGPRELKPLMYKALGIDPPEKKVVKKSTGPKVDRYSRNKAVANTIVKIAKKGFTFADLLIKSDDHYVEKGGSSNPTATTINKAMVDVLVIFDILELTDKIYKLKK